MSAIVFFGLEHHERGIAEHSVVARYGDQLSLPKGGLLIEIADDQPGGDRPPLP